MTALLERLLDLVIGWITYLLPFTIMGDDQCGLIRRLSVYKRDLKPGLNWKWPILEYAMVETSALDSTVLREQSITTSDGRQITLRGVLCYRVDDPRKYILGCATASSVVNDVGCCVIAEMAQELSAAEVLTGKDFETKLLRRMRARAKRWGVDIDNLTLIDRVETRVYRLITSAAHDTPAHTVI
jgi:regulator of protease activity HflC (stomatin/prohibitin superfamily)